MNTNTNLTQPEPEVRRFLSMSAFREAHSDLVHKHHALGDSPEFLIDVQEFIKAGQALGELLDSSDDRWVAQGMLDYWATVLFRASYDPPDVMLADFDLSKAPDLDPSLCPYRGLDAFQEDDHGKFFGRHQVVSNLLERIRESRLVCVVGSSGSGKSSLVRAGLIPMLRNGGVEGSQNWNYYRPFVPGSNPLESLIDAIHPPKSDRDKWISKQLKALQEDPKRLVNLIAEIGLDLPTVLVIDQFEELFTLCTDESLRHAFINNLIEFIQAENTRHTVILTMRVDFLEHLSQFIIFESLFRSNMQILPLLNPVELREVIEEPANLIMLKFEDGVVDALIDDVRNDRAPLPLLQFALLKLWDNKERNRITMKAYLDLEGAHGALPRTADKLYRQLSPEDQGALRYILVKLSRQPSKGQEVTRDRVSLKSLYEDGPGRDRVEWVLNRLVDEHLVRRTDGDTEKETLIEIAHEALVRNWQPLLDWLDEDRILIRRRESLNEAAFQWEANGRDPGLLWRGSRLEDAASYRDLNPTEQIFIQTAKETEKAEREREIAQRVELEKAQIEARYERDNAMKFRKLNQELEAALNQAKIERDRAEKQARLASSREIAAAAINNLSVDPERSILLAMHAISLTHSLGEGVTPEAEDALHRAIRASRSIFTLSGHMDQVRGIAFSPDGSYIATASHDNTVKVWDNASGNELLTLLGHSDGVLDVAFSPRGTYLATAGRDRTVRVWRVSTGEPVCVLQHERAVLSVAFSPNADERLLASGGEDEAALIWNLGSGKIVHVLDEHNGAINRVSFSPDGSRLATASRDKTVNIWDVKTGELLRKVTDAKLDNRFAHSTEVLDVAFSPDGRYLVTAGQDSVKVWRNHPPREMIKALIGHKSWVESVAFSQDAKYLATGSQDGTAKVWNFADLDLDPGNELCTLAGHTNRIYRVAFSSDGERLATAGRDGVAKVWNISLSPEVFSILGHDKEITNIQYNRDGTLLATTSRDRTAKIWHVETQKLLHTLGGHGEAVLSASFSPDGNCLATAGLDNKIIIWETKSGKALRTVSTYNNDVLDVTFSPNGNMLAAACKDGNVRIWETDSFSLINELKHPETVYCVAFSPTNDKHIATVGEDCASRIWDCSSREQIAVNRKHISAVRCVAFSPDGAFLATGSFDKSAMILDLKNGHVVHTLLGHTQGVVDIMFSPDGKKVFTASDDGTVKVWEVESGREILTLSSHINKVKSISLSPDGRQLASAGQDGIVCVYALAIEDLLSLARQRATRALRPEECQKYLHTDVAPQSITSVGSSKASAKWLVVHGRNLARGGDTTGAMQSFQKARLLDPEAVQFDPETEAQRLFDSIFRR